MAGTGSSGIAGNGGPATSAQINKAAGLWLTTAGTLFIGEYENHLVRRITTSNIISMEEDKGLLEMEVQLPQRM
jgi:hypothetical protein